MPTLINPTRRAALRHLASAATALPILGQNPPPESHHSTQPVTHEAATAHKFRFFQPEQLETLDALTETIIPIDDHSPGAKAARVSEYIDIIVADAPESTRKLWSDGVAAAGRMANGKYGKAYMRCSANEQVSVMTELAESDSRFFKALKQATVDGYYTSSIGIHQELEYQGNQAMGSFPGCTHDAENHA
jgi:hypothetical protein